MPSAASKNVRGGGLGMGTRFEPAEAHVYAAVEAIIRDRHAHARSSDDGSHVDEQVAALLFFNDPATTEIYTLSLHDALPISSVCSGSRAPHSCSAGSGTQRSCRC